MLKKFIKIFGGDPNARQIQHIAEIALAVNAREDEYEALSDAQLAAKTLEFRRRLALGETLDDLIVEAFAAVREASKRTIGLRHYDIQLVGGVVLHRGTIAEMRTGEGKTLVSTLPIYLNALALNPDWVEQAAARWGTDAARWDFTQKRLNGVPLGAGVHLVTVNDYLARRDARWKAPIYQMLGMEVGVLQMAARTDHGKLAYLVDLSKSSPHEDQHQLLSVPRKEAYDADITYGTTNEFGFDYLRDNMKMSLAERVQRRHPFAVIDEVDNVLIDEARTPLIISGPSHDESEHYARMAQVVRGLNSDDFDVDERSRSVALTEIGEIHVEQILGESLRDPERPEDITPEQARLMGYLEQALIAQHIYKRNKDYLVQGGKVIIVDENTGRLMPGRRWSNGLHQAIEAKEGVKVQSENVTYATITIQNYYRMYDKLCGMTGTAATEAEEFHKIYKLDVLEIPTNLEYQASRPEWELEARQAADEDGYKYTYYAHPADDKPRFFKRKDYPDVIFRTEEAKFRAIGQEILRYHTLGRPILVGTTSVELSDRLSSRLKPDPIRKLAQVIVIRDAWMQANNREADGRIIPELEYLSRPLGLIPQKQVADMARELDINLNPLHSANVARLLDILRLPADRADRLLEVLKNGIPHQVLNARKHTEESQIIAGAGAFGAVTIATNMAGRGVDIKLGGELPEETLTQVNRVLKRAGYHDPYDLTLEDRRAALEKLTPEEYGLYRDDVAGFLRYMEESRQVKQLGGLHVIGSERHDSRRIDNQLRGRAARQGDPGSSRFYLSMQDDLMRLFGGQQAEAMMERLKIDEEMPIEMGMVSRLVEQSQTRVEGANFDTRKHLLEYDDVLNNQRAAIYNQRDRIFTKDDLTDDVNEMLETEINLRVPEALADPEGPWKLLAWADQTQPTIVFGNLLYPSLSIQTLLDDLQTKVTADPASAFDPLLNLAADSLAAEQEHLLDSTQASLQNTRARLRAQYEERREVLDLFLDGIDPDDPETRRPGKELHQELTSLLRASIKLDSRQQQQLETDPEELAGEIENQLETFLVTSAAKRLITSLEHRLGESIELAPGNLQLDHWQEFGESLLAKITAVFDRRRDRYIGKARDGLIARDIRAGLEQIKGSLNSHHLANLLLHITQGQRAAFDRKTHQRIQQRTTRLTYAYHASRLFDKAAAADRVLKHFRGAQQLATQGLGMAEFARQANLSSAELSRPLQRVLEREIGGDAFPAIRTQPLRSLDPETSGKAALALGKFAHTHTYRQLLLRVISELWVEYLTQMEALRVSVGLEAYAQRDPLVAYKSRASELFQQLLADTRRGVVSRMFTFRVAAPVADNGADQPAAAHPPGETAPEEDDLLLDEPAGYEMAEADGSEPASASSKRRRRRKKR
jgi:preprotein translocase subunit SecA